MVFVLYEIVVVEVVKKVLSDFEVIGLVECKVVGRLFWEGEFLLFV